MSGNIFDFYYRVISRLEMDLPNPFELEEDNIHRKKETDLHAAIREALTNTLVNADYSLPRGLVVKKSVNKITFENPGILRISKKQALKGGISDPRNSTILHFFNQIGIGERAGSGIPTIINAFLKREYIEPIIKEEINPERTTLVLSFDKEKSNVTKGNNKNF